MTRLLLAATLGAALASAGCSNLLSSTPTSPSVVAPAALLSTGSYASVASDTTSQTVCTNFKWQVTDATLTSVSGTFTATCYGTLQVAGTAQATLSGTVISWTASATTSTPAFPVCTASLSGTVEIGTNQIRVPYTGTTCLGPVSGAEILRR